MAFDKKTQKTRLAGWERDGQQSRGRRFDTGHTRGVGRGASPVQQGAGVVERRTRHESVAR